MPGGLDLSYLSQSVQLGQFTDKEYEEIMAYSFSTNIKYAVHFQSTGVWEGFVY